MTDSIVRGTTTETAGLSDSDPDFAVRLLRDLIKIPSFTGKEHEISQHVAGIMKSLGLRVQEYDSGEGRLNIVGTIRGNSRGRTLMLNGHLDTQAIVCNWTRDPLGGCREGDKIFGVGAADQKAGVAAMIGAAKLIIDSGVQLGGDLTIAAVVGHMEGGRGTRTLLRNGVRADYAVVTEPTGMKLMVEGGGIVYLDIETRGRAAFTPERRKGVNAILEMTKVVGALERARFKYKRARYIRRPYLNIGTIKGGIWPSIVPDSCKIQVDLRTLPSQNPAEILESVKKEINRISRSDKCLRETKVSFNPTIVENPRYPWSVAGDNLVVRAVAESIRNASGRGATKGGFQGWVDGGVLNKEGIPTIVYGPGDIDQIYAPDEHARARDVVLAEKVYALAAKEVCS